MATSKGLAGLVFLVAPWTLMLKFGLGQLSSNHSDAIRLVQDVTKLQAVLRSMYPDVGHRTDVAMTFFPMSIISLVEREQRFTVSAWFYVTWNDVFLHWSPEDYGNISKVYVAHDQIWKPDLTVINGADKLQSVSGSNTELVVNSDGRVEWFPGNVFSVICRVDLTSFPFDRQDCYFQVSSWLYTAGIVSLTQHTHLPINYESWRENSEWELERLYFRLKNQTGDGRVYDYAEYHYVLRRRSTFYVLKYLAPVVILSLVSTFVFCVPPQSGEKVSLSVSTMLSLTVFLAYLTDITPSNSDTVPEVAIFVVLHLTLGACGVVGNVLLLKVYFYRLHQSQIRRRRLTRTLWTRSVDGVEEDGVETVTAERRRRNTAESLWATNFCLEEDFDAEEVLQGSSSSSSGRSRGPSYASRARRSRDLNGISSLNGRRSARTATTPSSFSPRGFIGIIKGGGNDAKGTEKGLGWSCRNNNSIFRKNEGDWGSRGEPCRDDGDGALDAHSHRRRCGDKRRDDVDVIDDDYNDNWVDGASSSACSVQRLGGVCFVVFLLLSALVSAVFFGRNVN